MYGFDKDEFWRKSVQDIEKFFRRKLESLYLPSLSDSDSDDVYFHDRCSWTWKALYIDGEYGYVSEAHFDWVIGLFPDCHDF